MMNTNESYIVPNWNGFSSIWKIVAIILAVLVILLYLLGYGPGGDNCPSCANPDVASEMQTMPSPSVPVPVAEEIAVISSAGGAAGLLDYLVPEYQFRDNITVEKLYFDLGSYELPGNTAVTLSTVIAYLRNNEESVAVISGFHDPSGNLLSNQELAKNRAVAARDYLIAQNLDPDRLVLEKPVQTTGSGSADEARRVEVGIADLDN